MVVAEPLAATARLSLSLSLRPDGHSAFTSLPKFRTDSLVREFYVAEKREKRHPVSQTIVSVSTGSDLPDPMGLQ